MSAEPDYSAAWRDLRKRYLLFWGLLLGYLPGVSAIIVWIGAPLARLTGGDLRYFAFPVAVLWMLALLIARLRVVYFP
jgi:hypothetical protein